MTYRSMSSKQRSSHRAGLSPHAYLYSRPRGLQGIEGKPMMPCLSGLPFGTRMPFMVNEKLRCLPGQLSAAGLERHVPGIPFIKKVFSAYSSLILLKKIVPTRRMQAFLRICYMLKNSKVPFPVLMTMGLEDTDSKL